MSTPGCGDSGAVSLASADPCPAAGVGPRGLKRRWTREDAATRGLAELAVCRCMVVVVVMGMMTMIMKSTLVRLMHVFLLRPPTQTYAIIGEAVAESWSPSYRRRGAMMGDGGWGIIMTRHYLVWAGIPKSEPALAYNANQ